MTNIVVQRQRNSNALVTKITRGRKELLTLAEEINRELEQERMAFRLSVTHAIRVGERLERAKELVPYGEWEKWVTQFNITARTARYYMRLARMNKEERKRVSELPLREAVKTLAKHLEIEEKDENIRGEKTPKNTAEANDFRAPVYKKRARTAIKKLEIIVKFCAAADPAAVALAASETERSTMIQLALSINAFIEQLIEHLKEHETPPVPVVPETK